LDKIWENNITLKKKEKEPEDGSKEKNSLLKKLT